MRGLGLACEAIECVAPEETLSIAPAQQDGAAQMGGLGQREVHGIGGVRQRGQGAAEDLAEIDVGVVIGGGQQGREFGVGDDVAEFGGLVAGIEGHDHAAEQGDAEERLDELAAVGGHEADVLAGAHAECEQCACDPGCAMQELRIGVAPVGEHHRVALRMKRRGAHQ
ncbi:hypothetical protein PTE30175_05596 [Pandoraea terrae]|uniref:Uncharacterized protein n=1 Tax=Pandoraea terrae TaxID=1537710 RepID=A0A5E4ZF82_9BURK|nr:hypothetical protein PTE30175_05596 [Pandoraea terrae]